MVESTLSLISILRFLLSVCLSICEGYRLGHNEFVGRVQNHHVRLSFHRIGHNFIVIIIILISAAHRDTLCYVKDAIDYGRLPLH